MVFARRARIRSHAALVVAAVGWLLAATSAAGPAGAEDATDGGGGAGAVLVTTVDDMIGPVVADHVGDGVERAAEDGYEAYVVLLDTPGGLDTSMRAITQRFLDDVVPVVVYVTPSGARAASAGAIITLASHVAAMAPGTVIGAATPVGLEGGDLEQKVINDAAALAESIADVRGRDVDFAVDAVREGRSVTAEEAVEIGAVDLLAPSLPALLDEIDGTSVTLAGGRAVTLETADAAIDEHEMGAFDHVLQVLADPNLAFLFMSIGTLGLLYELASPGIGVGGVLGLILVVLALFSFSVLPIDAVGLVFLALAAALYVAELFAPGIGIFAGLGTASLVLSGLFLFDDVPGVEVSLVVVLPTAVVVGAATVLAGRLALRSRRAPSTTTGAGALVGRPVRVRRADGRHGETLLDGTWWSLRADEPLREGDEARVVGVEGLDLVVEPVERQAADEERRQ